MNTGIFKILKHPATLPIGIAVLSFGSGVCAGYILGRRSVTFEPHDRPSKLRLRLDKRSLRREEEEEGQELRAEVRTYLEEIEEKDRIEKEERDPDGVATPAESFILEHLEGTVVLEEEPKPPEIEEVAQSIFAGPTDEWDYNKELTTRSTTTPYVLHRDEFYAEELGYQQTTLTYYAGDDILADQEDSPVYNHSTVVGPLLFGHGSGDPNVFHVRNDLRREEYEILFDEGHFSVEVLGLEIENNERVKNLKHDRYRKFRPAD